MSDLEQRVARYADDIAELRQILRDEGPRLVKRLYKSIGLREAARRCGLSSAYLSSVMNRRYEISPRSFLTLCELERLCLNTTHVG